MPAKHSVISLFFQSHKLCGKVTFIRLIFSDTLHLFTTSDFLLPSSHFSEKNIYKNDYNSYFKNNTPVNF